MKPAYYNEHDPYAAAWLRNLIAAGHIAPGVVDERSIVDVDPAELEQYGQCHFFAGIGGWSRALRLAGRSDADAIWTGSCPCQPFSVAGARKGIDDERHLWPAFRWLIAQRRPAEIYGEQVASEDGRQWLAGVRADLEAMGYAVGAADLCAAGARAPNIRQRLWWVAYAVEPGLEGHAGHGDDGEEPGRHGTRAAGSTAARGEPGAGFWSAYDLIPCADGKARRVEPGTFPLAHGVPARVGKLRAYGNAINPEIARIFIEAAQ